MYPYTVMLYSSMYILYTARYASQEEIFAKQLFPSPIALGEAEIPVFLFKGRPRGVITADGRCGPGIELTYC
jgi:hypothetical protein